MKTLVVGLGNIGTMYGWALAQAGVDVAHVVRKGKSKEYERGTKLDVLDLRKGYPQTQKTTYRARVVEEVSPADGYELVVVPTQGRQLAGAVRQFQDAVPASATFLLFGANWEGPQEIDRLLPRSRYVWGYAAANGGRVNDVLYVNMRDDYRIGSFEGCNQERLEAVIRLFGRAGLRADFKPNIIEWLWVHYAINCGLIGTFLYAGGAKQAMSDPALMIFSVYAVRDALKVLEKRGVAVDTFEDTKPFLQAPVDEFARSYANSTLNTAYGERAMTKGHFSGSPEEMRRFYLDVVNTGEQLGVHTPHLSAMKARIEALRF